MSNLFNILFLFNLSVSCKQNSLCVKTLKSKVASVLRRAFSKLFKRKLKFVRCVSVALLNVFEFEMRASQLGTP
jgi:hypothetical protein